MEETTKALYEQAPDIKPEGWSEAPTLKALKEDLMHAKPSSDAQKTKIKIWLDNLRVEGSAKKVFPKGSSSVQPRLIRKQAEWRYAALSEPFLSTEDLFTIDPVTFEDVKASYQNGLILNHQIRTKMDRVKFIDEYVRAAVDEGTIIVKTGWDFEEREVIEKVPEVELLPNPELAPLFQELDAMKQSDPTTYMSEVPKELQIAHEYVMESGIPVQPRIVRMVEEKVLKTVKNCPSLEICDYRNITADPSCKGDLDKAQFIIHSFETSLSELTKDKKYSNLEHINAEANSPLGDPDHHTEDNSDFNFSDKARKRIVAHEYWGYWDYKNTGIAEPFVATWVGDTMIRLEESPFPDKKLPFVFVPMLPVKHSLYGEPDGELLLENQKIIGAVTRGMIDILGKSANAQTGIRKDALDAVNKRKYDQGKDYQYNAGVDPRMAFYMHTYPEIPQSAQYMLNMQNADAESMSGVKAFAGGITSNGLGEVATGIRGALDAASKRETGILRRLAKGVADIGRKIIAMNSEFLEDEEIIRITNESFVAIRREDLAGNFDLRVDVSSAEEDNVKAQELAFMLQTMGNNMDPGMSKIILRDIARLRKMTELAHAIENYEPQPDPVAGQMQQLQMQKIQLEMAELESKIQSNYASAGLDQAKAQEAIAKARTLSSEADLKDLDFVEQESGVKQEREKELYGEQARSNMQLEALKHEFTMREKQGDRLQEYLNNTKTQKSSAK